MAITQDGYASNTGSNNTGGTVTLSTTNNNDIIVLAVYSEDSGHTPGGIVNSVSSTNTTGWTKRSSTTSTVQGGGGAALDIWYGKASAPLSSEVITLGLSASVDGWAAIAGGWSGVDQTTIWDTNGSLPAVNKADTGSSAPSVAGCSTTALNTAMLAFAGSPSWMGGAGWANPGSAPSGWSGQGAVVNGFPPGLFACEYGAFQIETSVQSGITVTFSNTIGQWIMAVDALRAAGQAVITKSTTYTVGF